MCYNILKLSYGEIMKRLTLMAIALPIILYGGCGPKSQHSTAVSSLHDDTQVKFVTVQGRKFIDPQGRQLILHGTNIVDKSKEHNYLSWHGPEEFAQMREWGFNCIRLVIIWDGVEPEPGQYDDKYLASVDKRVQWAKENGMYVLLDMHQDLFSAKFGGDGAPDWATLDEGKDHIHKGNVWSTAYFTSPAVQTAFDNFWANKAAPDGIGIQEHFARAWRHVAKRYADEPAVIGYDLFNEPFPGSAILQTLPLKFKAAVNALAKKQGGKAPGIVELMKKFTDSDGLTKYVDDFNLYKAFTDGGVSSSKKFEQTVLASFYNRVARAIRQVDKNHIIFIEPHILCNVGTPSGIVPILDADGNQDPLQALAPHGYDIVTDTEDVANASPKRLALIFERHAETSKRLNMPVLVGEWGAFGGKSGTLPAAQMVVDELEKHLLSDTYWCYSSSQEMDEAPYFPVLARPYPAAIAGKLLNYRANLSNGEFSCIWKEEPSITASSRIYLPAQWGTEDYSIDLEPEGEGWTFEPIMDESSGGYLVIPSTNQAGKRRLTIQVSNKL